ncbi:MAG: hypothetical protein WDN26_23460 [Chitinophagaceae bacterium]
MNANIAKLVTELNDLDLQPLMVEGKMIKPSQCFRYETDPLHFMFNTNCPDELKERVNAIFGKYNAAGSNRESAQKVV